MRFISTISQGKLIKLKDIYKNDPSFRVRERAHAILLSNNGFTIDQLAKIFEVDRDSISSWFNRWENKGLEGLSDLPKSGRPATFFDDLKKK